MLKKLMSIEIIISLVIMILFSILFYDKYNKKDETFCSQKCEPFFYVVKDGRCFCDTKVVDIDMVKK